MKKLYRYDGPVTGAMLSDGRVLMLYPGRTEILPTDDEYVKTLVAQGRLKEVSQKPPARKSKEKVIEEVDNDK